MSEFPVWSHEHDAWRKPGGWGYTDKLVEAGVFSPSRAMEICEKASYGWVEGKPPEVMIPFTDDPQRAAAEIRKATKAAIEARKAGAS